MPKPNSRHGMVSSHQIGTAAVSGVGRQFGLRNAKGREARITVTFTAANTNTAVFHGLGFVPTGFIPLSSKLGTGGAGGKIYSDVPLVATAQSVVLRCDTANTIAEIMVR